MQKLFKNKKILYLSSLLIAGIVIVLSLFIFQKNQETATATEWYDESWYYRQQFTIDSTKIDEDLENFPIAVQFNTTTNPYSNTNSDGSDIRFTDNSGNLLSYEIETWNESGTSTVHVKIPTISAGADTKFYMYYGNPSAQDAQDAQNVWDENFVGVWHLGEGDSTSTAFYQDSTGNNNHGTLTDADGDMTAVAGKIDGALNFTADFDYIRLASLNNVPSSQLTICAWLKTSGNNYMITTLNRSPSNFHNQAIFQINSSGKIVFWDYDQISYGFDATTASNSAINDNSMHYACFSKDETAGVYYIDGVADGTKTATDDIVYGSDDFIFGYNYRDNNSGYAGVMDEVTISNTPRTPAWIKASYHSGNGTLLSTAVEEQGPGPVGYWSFDDGYGTTASDMTVNNNDGTITGATWKNESECVSGKCLSFDGSDYIKPGDIHDMGVNDMTISVWFKTANDGEFDYLISKTRSAAQDYRYGFSIDDQNKLRVFMKGNGGSDFTLIGNTDVVDNQWHHAVVVFDRSANASIYVDGTFDGSGSISIWNEQDFQSNNPFHIGSGTQSDNITPWYNFNGLIDEVKIYNYARTPDQIKQDYNKGKAVFFGSTANNDIALTDGLVGYWKFDEASANTCTGGVNDSCDSSGLGNDGAWNGDASAITTAKFGRGVGLDGGDYVNVGSGSSIDMVDEFTVAAWVNANSVTSNSIHYAVAKNLSWYLGVVGTYPSICGGVDGTIYVGTGSLGALCSTTVMETGQWYYLLFTHDENGTKLYINGELSASSQLDLSSYPSSDVYIGNRQYNTGFGWNGAIDEVRIYNRALNPEEVRRLYEYAPGPVGWWKLDENSGTASVYDSSGNGNTGTMNGAMTESDWVPGKYGSALAFDGNDDGINVGSDASLDVAGGDATWSAWIYPQNAQEASNYAEVIFDKESGGFGSGGIFVFLRENLLCIYNGSASCGNIPIQNNKWTHIALVNEGSSAIPYINGVADIDLTWTGGYQSGINQSIGYDSETTGRNFTGTIDDVRIYNYARTQKQILEDMHAGRPNQPIAYYGFDEMQGTTAYDEGYLAQLDSANANNGTLTSMSTSGTSTAWTQNGKKGGALSFDGVDDYVDLGTEVISQDTTKEFSISSWVKSPGLSSLGPMKIVDQSDTGNPYEGYQFGINSSNEFSLYIRDNDGDYITQVFVTPSEYNNSWTHLVATYDGSKSADGIKLYANGKLLESSADSSGSLDNSVSTTGIDTVIGARDNGVAQFFNGLIDEVKIYNYALTLDEIRQEYNTGAQTVLSKSKENVRQVEEGLVGWWKMDEASWSGSSGEVIDSSGSGNHGTASSGANTTATAKYGRAGDFDGVDDYINLGSDSSLDFSGNFTTSFWINMDDIDSQTVFYPLSKGQFTGWDIGVVGNYSTCGSLDGAVYFVNGNSEVFCSTDVVTDNQWYHIGSVYKDGLITLFINGKQQSTYETEVIFDATQSLTIGRRAGGQSGTRFNGQIDDVKIYNYARTPDQIMADYVEGPPPIAWWDFDEMQGTTAQDRTGNGNTGTITGAEFDVAGKISSALKFDGVDDYVNIADYDNETLDLSAESFSVSTWIKTNDSGNNYFVAKRTTGSQPGFEIGLSGGKISWYLHDGTNSTADTDNSAVANNNVWNHILVVFDRVNNKITRYLNGVRTGSVNSFNSVGSISGDSTLAIGARSNSVGGSPDLFFNGYIDDVKIYNYALNQRQVMQEYNGGAPVAWYKFDEGEGGLAKDASGNGNHGTIYPGAGGSNTSTSTMWSGGVNGKKNGSLEFDGTDDYVDVSDDSLLDITGAVTLSAWVNTSSSNGTRNIIAKGDTAYGLQLEDTNVVRFYLGGNRLTTTENFLNNTWTYLTAVYTGTERIIYINGRVSIRDAYSTNPLNTATALKIGKHNTVNGQYFNGQIDEVKIFNYALTPEEIKKEYNAGFVNYFK